MYGGYSSIGNKIKTQNAKFKAEEGQVLAGVQVIPASPVSFPCLKGGPSGTGGWGTFTVAEAKLGEDWHGHWWRGPVASPSWDGWMSQAVRAECQMLQEVASVAGLAPHSCSRRTQVSVLTMRAGRKDHPSGGHVFNVFSMSVAPPLKPPKQSNSTPNKPPRQNDGAGVVQASGLGRLKVWAVEEGGGVGKPSGRQGRAGPGGCAPLLWVGWV